MKLNSIFIDIILKLPNCNIIIIKLIIKLRKCNKNFSNMKLHKTSVTQNLKLFLLQVSEFPNTSIRIFNTL